MDCGVVVAFDDVFLLLLQPWLTCNKDTSLDRYRVKDGACREVTNYPRAPVSWRKRSKRGKAGILEGVCTPPLFQRALSRIQNNRAGAEEAFMLQAKLDCNRRCLL
ncbi:hypothetical protein CEXT_598031 [Caerostris extrusa]|uniref:Uncharacterized protein n=1 Tax=Caerostris extrusa TaxID=172846 RepID=A0AAV4NS43_CAEEX|nr:hypothetical protein CEXT_598031 [Caerostris extrusa]